jgi:hypothetical protein
VKGKKSPGLFPFAAFSAEIRRWREYPALLE